MAAITETSIRRPVATAMLFLSLIVIGLVSFRSLPVDLLPEVEFTQLTVRVRYPNVGPSEIEQILTDPIENAISGLPNLERVSSRAQEGFTWIRLDFARGTDVAEAANDLRAALDRIRGQLPIEADAPQIFKFDLDRVEVVGLAVTSTRPLEEVTRILEDDISQRFEQIPGVGSIEPRGGIYRQIRVELDRDRLRAASLTALDVQDALARENLTLPGGNVKRGYNDLYIRALGEYTSVGDIARTVIRNTGGRPIRVQDVADVRDDYEDVNFMVEINGVPMVRLGIQKQSGANTVSVADQIRAEVERINAQRDDLHLTVVSDQSEFIRQSIDSVRNSALWGSLLAILVLYLYLRSRSCTAIIGLSIPISVISTFGLLYFGGLTLNQMTFGGLALGVGLIVDNAIVVLESIVRKREEGELSAGDASIVGAREVAGAITASTLTTCVIFLPVAFTRTVSGALFQSLALVVVFALACSLFVALTLVPMLAARFMRLSRTGQRDRGPGRMKRLETWYKDWLVHLLGHRRRVFATTTGMLALALLFWPLIPVELAPQSDADQINVNLDMAQGTNIAVVRAFLDEMQEKVRRIVPPGDVEYVTTQVRGAQGNLQLKLVPQERRSTPARVLADRVRAGLTGEIPGVEVRVSASQGLWILRRIFRSSGGDEELQLELRGWDLEVADRVAAEVRRRVQQVPGVSDVQLSRREGRPEENLVFDRERISELGLSVRDVGRAIQANVGGVQASRLRQNGREYPIVVRLKPEDRLTGQDLNNVSLRTPAGDSIPLSTVVRRRPARGPTEIQRIDGQRVTYISASLENGVALGEAVDGVRRALAEMTLPDGFSVYFGGEYEEQLAARRDFLVAIVMALVLVYMLMAGQFERFLDPLIVMVSVPMALIGVVPTLLLTGTTLNIQSVMGLVMLIGIVVNNAIVLVDGVNLLRRERGLSIHDAVVEAGRLRLRPILMTTTTTVLGLLPLALGLGAGAEMQAALARVVIGGLSVSTLVTLVLVPATYVSATGFMERVRASIRERLAQRRGAEERAVGA